MGSEKRKGGGGEGGQGYFSLARKGGGVFFFVKKFRGDHQFDREVYFKRGPLAKMGKAVK